MQDVVIKLSAQRRVDLLECRPYTVAKIASLSRAIEAAETDLLGIDMEIAALNVFLEENPKLADEG